MSDVQERVQAAVDTLVADGTETGVQVAAYRHGVQVVDVAAGTADVATGRAMTADTPVFATSAAKGVAATVVHVLAERGVLGYETRVAELWPEFAAHGKAAVTVRHVLTHTAGVPAIPADTTPEKLHDPDGMCAVLADATPWWEPGTRTGYHGMTYGFLVGEIVRRATGRPIDRVLREDVAEPLGVGDELYFAVPATELPRLARLDEPPGAAGMLASMPEEMFTLSPRAVWPDAGFCNDPRLLGSNFVSGGTMTARAVARMYAALLGEVDGVRLIPEERLRIAAAPAFSGTDAVMGNEAVWALGWTVGRAAVDPQASTDAFGMVGMNGCAAWADRASGVAFGLTKTHYAMTDLESSTMQRVGALVLDALT